MASATAPWRCSPSPDAEATSLGMFIVSAIFRDATVSPVQVAASALAAALSSQFRQSQP
jgi:hypothetical protein